MAEIQHLVNIDVPPEKVYESIVSEASLQEWWTADVEAEEHEGGEARFGFYDRSVVYVMQIDKLSPGSEVQWTCTSGHEWSGTHIRFSLQKDNGGTQLRFWHSDWREETDYYWSCNTTWGELMYRLKAVAEGQRPGPLFSRTGLGGFSR